MNPGADRQRWLSCSAAAEFLGLDERRTRRLLVSKTIPALRLSSRQWLISRAACVNWLRRMGEVIPDDDAPDERPTSCRPLPGSGSLRH